ncbi:SDR family NAD(P)-dependent oxidoreductase [Desulfatirhabdium butyrativorans]|uniref:SDR family NAD(P)-dependent oxidoreductase n=1 Tax=Desulfatirhabdium butyrativorans TaxID=340467 RepID=UPI000403AF8C|nr:SDR family oxidoreductase [Desulfatirhabdium butyrativorans]
MNSLHFGLEDKVALVTGGSRGIGFAAARAFLDQGAKVAICGRKADGLVRAAAELNAGDRLLTVSAHVAKPDDVQFLFDRVIATFGTLDILVNNVGMNLITSVVDSEPSLWNKIIDSNLNATYLVSRAAARIMREKRSGKIVSISSTAARRAAPAMGVYGIAKAGIEMMTKVLAQELAAYDIQVNAVAPGMVKTDFSRPFWSDANLHQRLVEAIPLGRLAEPVDVVWPILFLCSDAARYMTGQTLMVDGGASAV